MADFACDFLGFGAGVSEDESHFDGGGDEGCRFVRVDKVEAFCGGFALFAEHVFDLAADELFGAGGGAEGADEARGELGLVGVGDCRKGQRMREQGVSGEQGDGFVEDLVAGRFAAAQIGIVHAGQVVVDQRVGVQAFDGDGGGQRVVFRGGDFKGRKEEDGADAFAAGAEAVGHRAVQERRAHGFAGDVALKCVFDASGVFFDFFGNRHTSMEKP